MVSVPLLLLTLTAASPRATDADVILQLFPKAKAQTAETQWGKKQPTRYLGPIFRGRRMGYVLAAEVRSVELGRARLIVFPIYLTKRTKGLTVEALVTGTNHAESPKSVTLIQAILVDGTTGKFIGKAPTFPLERSGGWTHAYAGRNFAVFGLDVVDMSGVTGARMTYGTGEDTRVRFFAKTEDGKLDASQEATPFTTEAVAHPEGCEEASVVRKAIVHEPRAYFSVEYVTKCACDAEACKRSGLSVGDGTRTINLKSAAGS